MAVTIVRDQAGLIAAVTNAEAGDTIRLQTGSYGTLKLADIAFASQVIIESTDDAAPALFKSLDISRCVNLTFKNLQVDLSAKNGPGVEITNSTGISVVDSMIAASDIKGSTGPGVVVQRSSDIIIKGNTVVTDDLHGISLENVTDSTVLANTLLHHGEPTETGATIGLLDGSHDLVLSKNVSSGVTGPIAADFTLYHVAYSNNLTVNYTDKTADTYVGNLFLEGTPKLNGAPLVQAEPGTLANQTGAESTWIDTGNKALSAMFRIQASDAGLIFDAIDHRTKGVTYLWDFGDGHTDKGAQVKHSYTTPGFFDVTLTVITKGGGVTTAGATAQVADTDILTFNTKTGRFEGGLFGTLAQAETKGLTVVESDHAFALSLGTTRDIPTLDKSAIMPLFGSDNFDLTLAIQATQGKASAGEILRIQPMLTLTAEANGALNVVIVTDDGTFTGTTHSAALLDGARHDVRIAFDGDTDSLSLFVDGKLDSSISVTGTLLSLSRDLTFGNAWDMEHRFTGRLLDFQLDVQSSQYPEFGPPPKAENPSDQGSVTTETPFDTDGPIVSGSPSHPNDTVAHGDTATIPAPWPDEASKSFSLDFANSPPLRLIGSVQLESLETGSRLSGDGTGGKAVIGRIEAFATVDHLAVSINFEHLGTGEDKPERLMSKSHALGLAAKNGGLKVAVMGEDKEFHFIKTGNLGLDDGESHTAVLLTDDAQDHLQLIVDGLLVLDETGIAFDTGGNGRWTLGGTLERSFEGDITSFSLDTSTQFFDNSGMSLFN